MLLHLEEICLCVCVYVCTCVYMCCHVPFNQGSQSAHRTNWSVGLPAVLADFSFCLSISAPCPPLPFFLLYSHSQFNSYLGNEKAKQGWKKHVFYLLEWSSLHASSVFFRCWMHFRDPTFSHWQMAVGSFWLTWPCLALTVDSPVNDPLLWRMMGSARSQHLLLSELHILSWYTLSLDTHFQGELAKCVLTLNWRDKSELQPATNMATLLLSIMGRKC